MCINYKKCNYYFFKAFRIKYAFESLNSSFILHRNLENFIQLQLLNDRSFQFTFRKALVKKNIF